MHLLAFVLTPLKQARLSLSLDQNLHHMQKKKVTPAEQLENRLTSKRLFYLTFDSSKISPIATKNLFRGVLLNTYSG